MVRVPPFAVSQLGSRTSSGRVWRPHAPRHSRGGPRPLGSQPRPQLLERAASKVADFTAFDRVGAAVRVYAHQFYRRDGTAGIWGGDNQRGAAAAVTAGRGAQNRAYTHARDVSVKARRDAEEMVARCLAPNASRRVLVEEQDGWLAELNISRYYGMSNRERVTARGWSLPLLKTYLCALESLRRAFGLLSVDVDAGTFVPAYVVFLRPDALLACELPVAAILSLQQTEVLVPNHRWFEGINDQMAAAPLAAARHWALRGDELLDYPQFKDGRRVVAEKTVVWALKAHGLTARPAVVPYYMLRPRRACDLRSCVVLDGGAYKSDTGSGLPAGQSLVARFAQAGQPSRL